MSDDVRMAKPIPRDEDAENPQPETAFFECCIVDREGSMPTLQILQFLGPM